MSVEYDTEVRFHIYSTYCFTAKSQTNFGHHFRRVAVKTYPGNAFPQHSSLLIENKCHVAFTLIDVSLIPPGCKHVLSMLINAALNELYKRQSRKLRTSLNNRHLLLYINLTAGALWTFTSKGNKAVARIRSRPPSVFTYRYKKEKGIRFSYSHVSLRGLC